MLVPHIDQMEMSLNGPSESDDEAATTGRIRELVQKAIKVIAENSFFHKDLEVRIEVMQLMNYMTFGLQSAGLTTIDDHSLDDSGQDLRYSVLLFNITHHIILPPSVHMTLVVTGLLVGWLGRKVTCQLKSGIES